MADLFNLKGGKLIAFLQLLNELGVPAEMADECLKDRESAKRRINAFKCANAPELAPEPVRFKRISENEIEVYLDVDPALPFQDAVVDWTLPGKTGTVILRKEGKGKNLKLWRDGVEVILHVDQSQKAANGVKGDVLFDKLKGMTNHLHPKELDALMANQDFIPESWKTVGAIFFWAAGFRDRGGDRYVRCLRWDGGSWCLNCGWLDDLWGGHDPAAVSAS